jgi:SPX domain protein involved in polyphosphate accumulation
MVAFGEHLTRNIYPAWSDFYINYEKLKDIIDALEEQMNAMDWNAEGSERVTSLSIPAPTNQAGMPMQSRGEELSEETFFQALEHEMRKIDSFTEGKVKDQRQSLVSIENQLHSPNITEGVSSSLKTKVDVLAGEYLELEKYVNLNFMGFHKILKKHDKKLATPIKGYFLSRLHLQPWVRGDHSDLLVTMSRVYSSLRGDEANLQVESERQVRIQLVSLLNWWFSCTLLLSFIVIACM